MSGTVLVINIIHSTLLLTYRICDYVFFIPISYIACFSCSYVQKSRTTTVLGANVICTGCVFTILVLCVCEPFSRRSEHLFDEVELIVMELVDNQSPPLLLIETGDEELKTTVGEYSEEDEEMSKVEVEGNKEGSFISLGIPNIDWEKLRVENDRNKRLSSNQRKQVTKDVMRRNAKKRRKITPPSPKGELKQRISFDKLTQHEIIVEQVEEGD